MWLLKQDRRIEELTVLLGQCRKIREVMALTQGGFSISSPSSVDLLLTALLLFLLFISLQLLNFDLYSFSERAYICS